MIKLTFPERIFNLACFQREYFGLMQSSISSEMPQIVINRSNNTDIDWSYLLLCASIFAQSDNSNIVDAALRISQHCLQIEQTNNAYKSAAVAILEMLTNRLAINLAIDRQLISNDYRRYFPALFKLKCVQRDIEHSIVSPTGDIKYLNKFQRMVYSSTVELDKQFVSISAPTSAGKSFILYNVLVNILADKQAIKNIVYIVPTRALISQVETDIKNALLKENIKPFGVYSFPQIEKESVVDHSNVFVFTQERLHWFRTENPEIPIHYLIVDEAHKIQDGSRGILLQQEIEELLNSFPSLKVYFSSPFTTNPELLLNGYYGQENAAVVKLNYVTVNQNLLFVSPELTDSKQWKVSLCHEKGRMDLGHLHLSSRPTSDSKKILFISELFAGDQGGVIIYANGAADAERNALVLYAIREQVDFQPSQNILNLIEFTKKTVHKDYRLITCLKRGVAFHYGNMPQLLRAEIERLFKEGELKFIICTSTLLEGVNLPARTLIINKPTRGKNQPMNSSDFWNLAGRAGRWGMEFQGNIVCIEPDTWVNTPDPKDRGVKIQRAIELDDEETEELIDFIKSNSPRSIAISKPKYEAAFSYFYTLFLNDKLDFALQGNAQLAKRLAPVFARLKDKIMISDVIIRRNPGISPIAMQSTYEYFVNYKEDLQNLIPMLPEMENAVNLSYIPLIRRISRLLSGDNERLAYPHALLVVDWMRGMPLPVLISKNHKYWQRKGSKKSIDSVIRDIMKAVEEYARFKFAKFSSCYIDILRSAFNDVNRPELSDKIPRLQMWLEFGVSQTTQLSFISLGLSRNTAIALSEYVKQDNLSSEECSDWLKRTNLTEFDISSIMLEEINKKVLAVD